MHHDLTILSIFKSMFSLFCAANNNGDTVEGDTTATQPHLSPYDEGGVVVQVEGVMGLPRGSFDVAFHNQEKGGGEIDDIQLKGDIALISFKTRESECFLFIT